MRCTIIFLVAALTQLSSCTENNAKQKTATQKAAYNFPIPKGWTTERINFPISFAPQINYTGVEDLRFAPGFETAGDEHWSYAFLWWLNGKQDINAEIIAGHLKSYYTGLLQSNARQMKIAPGKIAATSASITKGETTPGDIETYTGTVKIVDYMDVLKPDIILNIIVHHKVCKNNTALLFEISPQPASGNIWQHLHRLNMDFSCQ